jgi:hypothetical protein
MKTFNLNPAGFKAIRKRTLAIGIPLALIAAMAGIYISIVNDTSDTTSPNIFPFVIPLLLVAIGIGGFRGMKRQQELWNSYRLIFDDHNILRVQNDVPTITINKSEITEITESMHGQIQVKTASRHHFIHVPPAIENREELIAILSEFGTLRKRETKNNWTIAIPVLSFVFMVAFFIAKQKAVIISTGIILVFGLLWSFFEIQRSKLVDQKTKRSSWFIFLVLVAIAVRVLTALKIIGD